MSDVLHIEQSDAERARALGGPDYAVIVVKENGLGRQLIMATAGDAADVAAGELRRGACSVLINRLRKCP